MHIFKHVLFLLFLLFLVLLSGCVTLHTYSRSGYQKYVYEKHEGDSKVKKTYRKEQIKIQKAKKSFEKCVAEKEAINEARRESGVREELYTCKNKYFLYRNHSHYGNSHNHNYNEHHYPRHGHHSYRY